MLLYWLVGLDGYGSATHTISHSHVDTYPDCDFNSDCYPIGNLWAISHAKPSYRHTDIYAHYYTYRNGKPHAAAILDSVPASDNDINPEHDADPSDGNIYFISNTANLHIIT